MAELAVPLIALGSMYVISKQKDTKSNNEGYANMKSTKNPLPGINPPNPIKNFPTSEEITRE